MAHSLPPFEKFSVHSDSATVGTRFKKWLARFELMLTGMNITAAARKRALLLHYAGEEVYDIYDTFSDDQKGADDNAGYETLKTSLTTYFEPHKNVDYETYKFRQAKQEKSESIDNFCTRLRRMSSTCEFADAEREIKSQILLGCSSNHLRRKALREDMALNDLLKAARALEISSVQAQDIEGTVAKSDSSAHKLYSGSRDRGRKSRDQTRHNGHGKKCIFCGSAQLHARNRCPAKDKTCNFCSKPGHFSSVCLKKQNQKLDSSQNRGSSSYSAAGVQSSSKPGPNTHVRKQKGGRYVKLVTDDDPYDDHSHCYDESSDEYVFGLSHDKSDTPMVDLNFSSGASVKFFVDTGASVNIINEETFSRLTHISRPLTPSSTRIFAYGKATPLETIGQFSCDISYNNNRTCATFHVVKSERNAKTGNLLSYKTAENLKLIQFAFNVTQSVAEKLCAENPEIFDKMGKMSNVKVNFYIDETVQPTIQPHRRIPYHMRKKVEQEIERLEKLDVIEKVDGPTPWVSPIVVAPKPKKPDEIRICVDMRQPNKAIKRTRHIMPTMDDILMRLSGAKVFSKLDLNSGYHQLELDESSRNITTFSTHIGLRRYKRLNFGVTCAAEIFQNHIAEAISDIPNCMNTSDDILVYATTQKQHDDTLCKIFERFKSKNLTLNRKKCEFNKSEIEFFGFIFNEHGVKPAPSKLSAVQNATAPTNVKELRSFLGLTNYVSRFVPNYAAITKPLRDLTRKNSQWHWLKEHEAAFQTLKENLSNDKTMSYFNPSHTTYVLVDAAPNGLGAILCQKDQNMKDYTIAYASRALTDVESRYSQTEREALAVVWACEHYHLYLFGSKFTVISDHKALETIFNSTSSRPSARIERWCLRLQSYDFTLIFKPGADNPADYLSRHPLPFDKSQSISDVAEDYVNFLIDHSVPKALTIQEIILETSTDPTLQSVKNAIKTNNWHSPADLSVDQSAFKVFKTVKEDLSVSTDHDVILKCNNIVIPKSLQEKVMAIAHEGHQGIVKTKQLLREKIWFPFMDSKVEDLIKCCIPCLSTTYTPKREPLNMTPLPNRPWSEVHADFAGPLPTGEYLLIVVDSYSRFPEVEIVNTTSARATIPKLDSIFARHGVPDILVTDNGSPFNSHDFSVFASQLGFKHRKITPYWPKSNGVVERFVKTLKKNVETSGQNWRREMNSFLRNYRATPHCTTELSPAEALYNRQIKTKLPSLNNISKPNFKCIKCSDDTNKQKIKAYADNRFQYVKPHDLKIGDVVICKDSNPHAKRPYKPEPMAITDIKGSMITAANEISKTTRNSTFFKHVNEKSNDSNNIPRTVLEKQTEPTIELRRSARIKERNERAKDQSN